MKKEKDIDKIFMEGLDDFVDDPIALREAYWHELKQRLGKNKKPAGIILWLPYLSGAAAVVLAFLGWWMLQPPIINKQKLQQQIAVRQSEKSGKNGTSVRSAVTIPPERAQPELPQGSGAEYSANNTGIAINQGKTNKISDVPANVPGKSISVNHEINSRHNGVADTNRNEILTMAGRMWSIKPNDSPLVVASIDILPNHALDISANTDNSKANKKGIKKTVPSFRPQFAMSVLASPEFNGIGSLQQTRAGYNWGLMFSAELIKKFTINTGINYSVKPYSLPFSDYHATYNFKYAPDDVAADCRLIDIPLNVSYQVYNQHRNKLSVGTGLSSYIMMHESYNYEYDDTPLSNAPTGYTVKTRGKYLFSIMNLEATYQRQINSKVGISLQPYLKLPLSNIGYSQAKIETAGLAVGLNWNINSLKQPK